MATYVLVHGAYQGGWIWKPVATRLRTAGHLALTPTLDGCGERRHLVRAGITVGTHAREIAQRLYYEDLTDVVLVGTSAGGMVVQKAAELARERVGRLVFVDALVLMPGEKVDDIVKRPAPNEITELTTGPTKADAESRLFRDLDPALRAWALARVTPHPIAALEAPMEPTTFWEQAWPATVIRCRRAANPPEHHQLCELTSTAVPSTMTSLLWQWTKRVTSMYRMCRPSRKPYVVRRVSRFFFSLGTSLAAKSLPRTIRTSSAGFFWRAALIASSRIATSGCSLRMYCCSMRIDFFADRRKSGTRIM